MQNALCRWSNEHIFFSLSKIGYSHPTLPIACSDDRLDNIMLKPTNEDISANSNEQIGEFSSSLRYQRVVMVSLNMSRSHHRLATPLINRSHARSSSAAALYFVFSVSSWKWINAKSSRQHCMALKHASCFQTSIIILLKARTIQKNEEITHKSREHIHPKCQTTMGKKVEKYRLKIEAFDYLSYW